MEGGEIVGVCDKEVYIHFLVRAVHYALVVMESFCLNLH